MRFFSAMDGIRGGEIEQRSSRREVRIKIEVDVEQRYLGFGLLHTHQCSPPHYEFALSE
jgi:hypothetical protein